MIRLEHVTPILRAAGAVALALTFSAMTGSCLDRPVAPATPSVNARVVKKVRQDRVSKIDLLFMIDNSSSMIDKQEILAEAVPDLVRRLVDPVCIDPTTQAQVGNRRPDGSCEVGEPDFEPIKDIHIGIITSSLGGHGAGVCNDAAETMRTFPHNDDRGHLVARTDKDVPVPTFMNQGFLNWNPTLVPGQVPDDVAKPFATMVSGVGQHGCGYEASLESIYRFLIDPEPYDKIAIDMTMHKPLGDAVLQGTDLALLQQRSDFLRPDSLVAVLMITDENDCSVSDGGQGFYSILPPDIHGFSALQHGTSACLTNPNDKCCFNCNAQARPSDCPDPKTDPECVAGFWTQPQDPGNLRCWHQKQRYGVDFLYPVKRYIDGFSKDHVPNRSNALVKNPLYDDLSTECRTMGKCAGTRDKSLVFVAGIIGVPWQDIALDPTDLGKGYLDANELVQRNVWPKILGDPNASPPVPPADPHMIESIAPRMGPGIQPTTAGPNADPFNGHEWNTAMSTFSPGGDLQYACIFPLKVAKTCSERGDCDCYVPPGADPATPRNPLCQDVTTGTYSSTQGRAKGYPGIRQLQVLQGIGEQAVIASICPAESMDPMKSDYGYRPAIAALIARLRIVLGGRCLPRVLDVSPDGRVPCVVIEAYTPGKDEMCDCKNKPGRVAAEPAAITPEVQQYGTCFCEITQLHDGDDRLHPNAGTICETMVSPPGDEPAGWCYVDPTQTQNTAQCEIVKGCQPPNRRIIRFPTSDSEPRLGATAVIMCQERSFPQEGGVPIDPCR
jgi:hypothetical protein